MGDIDKLFNIVSQKDVDDIRTVLDGTTGSKNSFVAGIHREFKARHTNRAGVLSDLEVLAAMQRARDGTSAEATPKEVKKKKVKGGLDPTAVEVRLVNETKAARILREEEEDLALAFLFV